MRPSRHTLRHSSSALALLIAVSGSPALAGALPSSGSVAAGSASIAASANTVTVSQTSARAAINWQSFDVAAGNRVVFEQPDTSSATLNRVTGSTPSTIAGQISANGSVFLINPNGIAITSSGVVTVGRGFVASSLDLSDADFLAGRGSFGGGSGVVANAGSIRTGQGGYVGLLGASVVNTGTIVAPAGQVVVGAGTRATLDLSGENFLAVALPAGSQLSADGSRVALSGAAARAAIRDIVNLPGTINALSANGADGDVYLGGTINVDSSAGNAGTIRALGLDTVANGSFSARALGASGNGGLIETSGETVEFAGITVDTTAANGRTGTWLVDPTNLTVSSLNGNTTAIDNALATSNVTLSTNDLTAVGLGIRTAGAGDIIIASPMSWSSGHTLTLSAFNNITLRAAINAPNGELDLTPGNDGTNPGMVDATATVNVGSFVLTNGTWSQVASSLPTFSAGNFQFDPNAANFLRATGGDGSAGNPYKIADVYGLQGINSPNLLGSSFALNGDINAAATANWNGATGFVPIGTDGLGTVGGGGGGFTGSLDGQGHIITGLTANLSGTDSVGLFGFIGTGGAIRNLGVTGASIVGGSYVGALAGYNYGTITDSYATGSVTGDPAVTGNVGGLVGYNIGGAILRSHAAVTVNGPQSVGGLVGGNYQGSITDSYATGPVTGSDNAIGGLVGSNIGGNITNSYSQSAVDGTGAISVGGLVGSNSSATITRGHATGTVTGASTVGGLVGSNSYGSIIDSYAKGAASGSTLVGGLVGFDDHGSITGSYATGTATGGTVVGGLVGSDSYGSIQDSYATGAASGTTQIGGFAGTEIGGSISDAYASGSVVGTDQVGGLVGFNSGGTIDKTYAIGAVSGTGNIGGLIGLDTLGSTTASFWDTQTTGQSASAGGTGLITAELKSLGTFTDAGWNIDDAGATDATWRIYSGNSYPLLRHFLVAATITSKSGTFTYDGKAHSTAGYTLGAGTDPALVLGTASFTAQTNAGTYDQTVTGLYSTQQGVDIALVAGKLTINPAALTVTYTANAASSTYGTTPARLSGSVSATGLVNGETLGGVSTGSAAWTTTATAASGVGSYAITGNGLTIGSNYSATFVQAAGNASALTINPASLTVTYTASQASSTYGTTPAGLTGSVTAAGLVNGDTVGGVTSGTAAWTTTASATTGVGSYAITGSGLSGNSANYTVSFAQAAGNASALTINPASLAVTADAQSRAYGAANPALTYSASGLVNGDTLSGSLATSANTASGVGRYAITQGSLSASANYTLAYTGANLTVNPATLTVTYTANAATSTYGTAPSGLGGSVGAAGLVNGDTLAGVTSGTAAWTTTATAASGVGSYAITGSGLSGNSANYNVTFAQAAGNATALTVNPASLTVTYVADQASSAYGASVPSLSGIITVTGLVNGDFATVGSGPGEGGLGLPGGVVGTDGPPVSGSVIVGTPIFTTSADSTSNVGSYAVTGSGLFGNS